MTSVLLIYPFFKPRRDRSVFRFPPLGISYIAASLRTAGYPVTLLDCTFEKNRNEALAKALAVQAEVVGIYCMVTMLDDSLWFAGQLRQQTRLLVAGGPLPTCDPTPFLEQFDVVVRGEGEQTMLDLLEAFSQGSDLSAVPGIVYRKKDRRTRGCRDRITQRTGHLRRTWTASPSRRANCFRTSNTSSTPGKSTVIRSRPS